jgi:hypothetical protein
MTDLLDRFNLFHEKLFETALLISGFERILIGTKDAEDRFARNDDKLPFVFKQLLKFVPVNLSFSFESHIFALIQCLIPSSALSTVS